MVHDNDLLSIGFWDDILSDQSKQEKVIREYYRHEFSPSCTFAPLQVAKILLSIIGQYKVSDIISLLRDSFFPFHIAAKDIPQFSNFNDCYHNVVSCLVESGYESVNFGRMGFLLREAQRNDVADKKYGENHAKTAALMGLCNVNKRTGITLSAIGMAFYSLSYDQQQAIKPQMCLYIPMMQNRFVPTSVDDSISHMMSILAASTQKRRYPNVRDIEAVISNALDHELYGS